MASNESIEFVDRCYGKNYVRLLHVRRDGDVHHIKELEVNTALSLSDTKDYLRGDNSSIIATDSQKNTVYVLAKRHGVRTIEEFALRLSGHFLQKYGHVNYAHVHIVEKPWRRMNFQGQEHNHSFIGEGGTTRYCDVMHRRHQAPVISAGLRDMKVLKTTKSAFINFVDDEFRTLPDMDDRVFCTVVDARWTYAADARYGATSVDYDNNWTKVQQSILEAFAGDVKRGIASPSVQKTLYDAAQLVFNRLRHVTEITIELPNVHAYEFDFGRFKKLGLKNQGEVFQPTDKPSGNIKATLRRTKAKL